MLLNFTTPTTKICELWTLDFADLGFRRKHMLATISTVWTLLGKATVKSGSPKCAIAHLKSEITKKLDSE